ncbi:DUF1501 domain-containing protein [Urbifossiella limnaea]|uniref:DUF1501 domain-containing protein n=1 Tax=Urbifossiella limnaea TaxID=2528023 RepID=A0A517XQJ0_9BACT|nr:DUF1501 domain-containing protein [Urbifossiella limnaea]QDU19763.1 hypothetical protein ETAA1_17000 [Urbifossiella limnaea]
MHEAYLLEAVRDRVRGSRRDWLRLTAAGFGSYILAGGRRGSPVRGGPPAGRGPRAKSSILLFMTGGPAQHETFDPKPDAPSNVRGEFGAIDTSVPGVRVSELMPHMARQAHRYAILRGTYHRENGHGPATHWSLTGRVAVPRPRTGSEPSPARIDPPCVGGVVRQLKGDRNGLPGAVQLPARIGDQNTFQWAGQHAGYLGERYDPLMLIDETWVPGELPPTFRPNPAVGEDRLRTRSHLLQELEGAQKAVTGPPVDSLHLHRERALSVLDSTTAWEAFLLKNERPESIARYGDTRFGRSCLIARRLVEAGVGHVTVTWYPDPPTKFNSEANFDTHSKHFTKMKNLLMPPVDRAFAALLDDLAERGLLDETLVAWTGEFGRTPKINGGAGRDHWGNVFSTVLAGGGVRGGQVLGSSDGLGAEPKNNPVHVSRFVATMLRAHGWDDGTPVYSADRRPQFFMPGKPLDELF